MQSLLNGSGGSKKVKFVFSNVLDSKASNTISWINANLPSRPISSIVVYLTAIVKFLDESNQISTTTTQLGNIKNLVSQFSGHIGNYRRRMEWYIIFWLDKLTKIEYNISNIKNNNGIGIKDKYQKIKHKVEYCKSSLEFEKERLESISKNAKMLQKQLESLIEIIKKYQSNVKTLNQFKPKLETLKRNKKIGLTNLTSVATSIVANLCKIQRISNCLNSDKDRVSITTIKQDVENINSSIKDINNILSVVKSHLDSLVGFKLEIDCKLLNEIESCIVGIVSGIHCKYCCLSSDISEIFTGQPTSVPTLGDCCQLSKTLECATTEPTCSSAQTGANSCQGCQDSQGSQACQFCECLKQLLTQSYGSNIEQKLKSIKKVICKLIDGKDVDECQQTQNQQCSHSCDTGQPQASNTCDTTTPGQQATNTCLQTNIRQLINCTVAEINKCQSSLQLTCPADKQNNCETIQSTSGTSSSPATTSSVVNCNELDKVKLSVDTVINKCNCCKLKEFLNDKNIKSFVGVLKWVMISNFRELFCLYLCFDKSILDEILCLSDKLEEMKLYLTVITFINGEIKCRIGCIKYEINQFTKQVEGLVNIMRSEINRSVSELECAIEGVARNLVRCSQQYGTNNNTLEVIGNIYHNKLDN